MRRLRIYLDTSVINFLFANDAPDFRKVTEAFFAKHASRYDLYVSDVVRLEISKDPAPIHRQKLLGVLESHPIRVLPMDRRTEVEQLARLYLARGVIPPAKMEDALHVAFAVVYEMDVLLSWNFKHLANVNTEARLMAVSVEAGYRHTVRLTSPMEVEDETD
jgi:predicted nucleic acid-binding protein